jgi:NADP-dependent 3-hydroxy acid dehydrogenase YdfG
VAIATNSELTEYPVAEPSLLPLDLRGRISVVTGASSGIGKAIVFALVGEGAQVCLIGRELETLNRLAKLAQAQSQSSRAYRADLTRDEDIAKVAAELAHETSRLDVLILCGGTIHHGEHASASMSDFDAQYQANVRGPYRLIQALLPLLRAGCGQIVFINSSSGLHARARFGQFAATQHAIKAIADSLRQEVNADGIRVLSVFPGRTATPRMERLFREESRVYRPKLLLQPEDVALMVIHALKMPRTAEVTDISIRPMLKSY